jgi:hypothetical protein
MLVRRRPDSEAEQLQLFKHKRVTYAKSAPTVLLLLRNLNYQVKCVCILLQYVS